jgi:hypothetical protein
MSTPLVKTLVVGQEVSVSSGAYTLAGKAVVVKVTSSGVEVQEGHGWVLKFDNEGVACDGAGTFEGGPWIIEDICPHVLASDGHHCTRCWTVMIPWEAK